MKKKAKGSNPVPGAVALSVAQAVETLAGKAFVDDTDQQLHTVESATELVLKTRQEAGLELPSPQELAEALDYVRLQPDHEA